MKLRFIKSSQKKKITKQLNEIYGISSLPYLLIQSGKEKLRAYSGHLSKEEILKLNNTINIELIGLYLIKQEREKDLRLTLDATHLLSPQITKNTININNQQLQDWLRGKDIKIKTQRGNIILKYNKDFIGCGKSNTEKIFNYLPKDRRLKN